MSESDPVRESVTALSRFFVGDGTLSETLQRVVELADRAVPPTDMTGLTMLVDGKPSTAFCSDDEAREIDQAQYQTGSGPCLQAFDKGEVFTIESTESDDRWPEFCASAAAHGILSTMSLPLQASDRSIGALNFYSRQRAAFRPEHEAAGRTFADQAAIALANAQAYWEAFSLSQTLGEAMKTRAVIEQAKGILMAQSQIDPDEAFALLVRASQRENRKLHDIAADLVKRRVEGGA